jgi:hypothetical protein
MIIKILWLKKKINKKLIEKNIEFRFYQVPKKNGENENENEKKDLNKCTNILLVPY